MLLLLAVVVGLAVGLAFGGKPANLASIRLRWPLVPVVALLVKEVALIAPFSAMEAAPIAYVISLAALVAWTLWHVERLGGIWLLTAGTLLNLVPVLANGGRMPVSPDLAEHGPRILVEQGHTGQYVLMSAQTNFNWLADWIGMPEPLARVLPQAYSPGDLVGIAALAVVGFLAVRTRPKTAGAAAKTAGRIVSDPP